MKQRIITSIFILIVAIPLLWFSDTFVWPIAIAALSVIGGFEFLRVLGEEKRLAVSLPTLVTAGALPLLAELVLAGVTETRQYIVLVFGVLSLYLFYLYVYTVFMRGHYAFAEAASVFTLTFYVVGAFSALAVLPFRYQRLLILPVFIGAWICDVFAYFVGMFFGKHKLIPEISPKKTVEGSVGGIVFAVAVMLLYGFIVELFTDYAANYAILAVFGLILSVVSQIGDLIMSAVKREHGVKDYGRLFPGHGGVLDRFDSILATSLATTILSLFLPPFH